jgi:hypothetical protein
MLNSAMLKLIKSWNMFDTVGRWRRNMKEEAKVEGLQRKEV